MGAEARDSRARTPSDTRRIPSSPVPWTAARSPRDAVLALQHRAGNRAVGQVLARRVVGGDPATRVVRLEVGYELSEKLARAAWVLTAKGPLDEAGVEQLRQIALEHWFGTIDDDERLFIAALLDAGNAKKLHTEYPSGFSENGSVIEFSAASIPETNRRVVRDSGRSMRLEPTGSDKSIKDPLDRDIVAMTGPFRIVAMQTLKLADKAGIDHLKVYFAMLNGASDSTPGDRAYAGAAYVIALSQRMDAIAREIMAQNLKIDEVSSTWFDAVGDNSQAMFIPESSGQMKGDTIYVPGTLDLDNIAHVGTLVHELQHATDAAAAASNPREFSRVDLEEAAYERQSRFLLAQLDQLTGGAQSKAAEEVAELIGPGHVYLMIVAALDTTGSSDEEMWRELVAIIVDVNDRAQAYSRGSGLEHSELGRALADTPDGNREKARDAVRYDNKRYKRSAKVPLGGLKGESRLDRTPAGAAAAGPAATGRTLARDPDPNAQGKTIEDAELAAAAARETALKDLAGKAKDPAKVRDLLLALVATYVPELRATLTTAEYAAKVKSFGLSADKGRWTLSAGDDVVGRAAAGHVADVGQELRGAVLAIAEVELSAGRPAVVWIGRERVRVTSETERKDAERIMREARSKYAITFDSIASRRASREYWGVGGKVTDERLKAVAVEVWDYREVKAFEKAFTHFAPILGDARRTSTRAKTAQETATVGKLTISPDDDPAKEDRTRGEHFPDARDAVLYPPDAELSAGDPNYFELHATHELAHGAFAPQLDAFIKATGWWSAKYVRSGKGREAPPDGYANTNAAEDIAQSVAYFFVEPDRLKKGDGKHDPGLPGNPCPKRFAFIRSVAGGWTPSKK